MYVFRLIFLSFLFFFLYSLKKKKKKKEVKMSKIVVKQHLGAVPWLGNTLAHTFGYLTRKYHGKYTKTPSARLIFVLSVYTPWKTLLPIGK